MAFKTLAKPKAFTQPSPIKTNSPMGHPSQNLGQFLHPAGKGKSNHVTTQAPKPPERGYIPPSGNYKPKASLGKRTNEAPANAIGLDTSDTNSEAAGSMMGPASLTTPQPSLRTKKVKSKQPMPFFGKMM